MVAAAGSVELDGRIAAVRANIRFLTVKASSEHGAANEGRMADRITELEDLLDALIKEREAFERRSD